MGDARRELPDRLQAIGVPQLLERGDAGLGLGGGAAGRLGEAVAHRVDLGRELADLVALRRFEAPGEVAVADAARLVAQQSHRTADEPVAEADRDRAAYEHDQERRENVLEHARPHHPARRAERLGELERGRARAGERERHVDVAAGRSGLVAAHHRHLVPAGETREAVRREHRLRRRCVGVVEPDPRQAGVAAARLRFVGDQALRFRVSFLGPDASHRRRHQPRLIALVVRLVVLEERDLALDAHVGVGGHHRGDPEDQGDRELLRNRHGVCRTVLRGVRRRDRFDTAAPG